MAVLAAQCPLLPTIPARAVAQERPFEHGRSTVRPGAPCPIYFLTAQVQCAFPNQHASSSLSLSLSLSVSLSLPLSFRTPGYTGGCSCGQRWGWGRVRRGHVLLASEEGYPTPLLAWMREGMRVPVLPRSGCVAMFRCWSGRVARPVGSVWFRLVPFGSFPTRSAAELVHGGPEMAAVPNPATDCPTKTDTPEIATPSGRPRRARLGIDL